MSLSAKEISRVVDQLAADLPGASVRRAISPADRSEGTVVLELRGRGRDHFLEICVSARFCRICRIGSAPRNAPAPHPFVMLLRRRAVGSRVEAVRQLGGDRAVAIDLARGGERASLLAELTSRHANLFWLDGEGVVVGSLLPNRSHKRRLVPGQPYRPPIPHPAGEQNDRFGGEPGLESQIADHYRRAERDAELEDRRATVARAARSAVGRLERLERNLERDLERAAEAERLQAMAFALQANLHRARRGMRELDATDFEGRELSVPLDPALDPAANMNRLFERAKRLRRALPRVRERIAETRAERERFDLLRARIPEAGAGELSELLSELRERFPRLARRAERRRGDPERRTPYLEFAIGAGRTARVGRSARENDELTLRHARPGDLWLHARGLAGSHVVVPLGRGEDPSAELLIDAAHLAAHFSKARGERDVEVGWTRRRYVQKPKGAPPGAVRLLREKTVYVRLEPQRLARLLGS
ncbi:MAG: NFACT family protein [Polyangia bacterium]